MRLTEQRLRHIIREMMSVDQALPMLDDLFF